MGTIGLRRSTAVRIPDVPRGLHPPSQGRARDDSAQTPVGWLSPVGILRPSPGPVPPGVDSEGWGVSLSLVKPDHPGRSGIPCLPCIHDFMCNESPCTPPGDVAPAAAATPLGNSVLTSAEVPAPPHNRDPIRHIPHVNKGWNREVRALYEIPTSRDGHRSGRSIPTIKKEDL
jgi:hypothetical protein